jgi:V8-like Glu-specific endopeptidase
MKSLSLGILLLVSTNSFSKITPRVIYGEDNRQDIYASANVNFKNWAKSTAAMINTSLLVSDGDNISIKSGTLEGDGICADERFSKQPTAAMCSGFLVGKNLLVTAGHCVTSVSDCNTYSWVFDYSIKTENASATTTSSKNVYRCSKIISRTLDRSTQDDYALIQLDREVVGRDALSFRKEGKIKIGEKIVVIGHPSGLPTKISDDATVRDNDNKYFFQSNLDTFGGNSGSAVLNANTGVVEGILVRGERDYEYDGQSSCSRPKKCDMEECRGEDVTRITNIKGL